MTNHTIQAIRQTIPVSFFPQHEVHAAQITRYAAAMQRGDVFPPVVVVPYGDKYMPLDGHHRLYAALLAGISTIDAWVVDHDLFEEHGEDAVWCGDRHLYDIQEDRHEHDCD